MSRADRLQELLSGVFERRGQVQSVNRLRDWAMLAEQDAENPVNPTFKEVQAFLNDKGRAQVFKEVKQEWPSRIRKPLKPGVHFAIDGLDWKTQAPQKEQPGHREQEGSKFILCMVDRATRIFFCTAVENSRGWRDTRRRALYAEGSRGHRND